MSRALFKTVFTLYVFLSVAIFFNKVFARSVGTCCVRPPSRSAPRVASLGHAPSVVRRLFGCHCSPSTTPLFRRRTRSRRRPAPRDSKRKVVLQGACICSRSSAIGELSLNNCLHGSASRSVSCLVSRAHHRPEVRRIPRGTPLILVVRARAARYCRRKRPSDCSPDSPRHSLSSSRAIIRINEVVTRGLHRNNVKIVRSRAIRSCPRCGKTCSQDRIAIQRCLRGCPAMRVILSVRHSTVRTSNVECTPMTGVTNGGTTRMVLVIKGIGIPGFECGLELTDL